MEPRLDLSWLLRPALCPTPGLGTRGMAAMAGLVDTLERSSESPCMRTTPRLTRREMLQLSAGSLLSLGLWPGALRAEGAGPASRFHFVAINDVHYMTERCARFLERVLGQIKAGPKPEFCLLAGDASDHGTTQELAPVKEAFQRLGVPCYPVPGNHDYLKQTDRSDYETVFPGRLNYHFEHQGWLFIGLDSTEGLKAGNTRIQPPTLQWLDDHVPKLDQATPLVLFTHFPLGEKVNNRPLNGESVLERLREHNLRLVLGGHYHASTERRAGGITLVTTRCCSVSRGNHDGSKEKGYLLCEVKDGAVARTFVEVSTENLA
jgi:predicted phosphodiesterase